MLNRDKEVQDIAGSAIQALRAMGKDLLELHQESSVTDMPLIQNYWLPMPTNLASKGVLMTSLTPPHTNPSHSIVFIPIGGHVKPHWHKGDTEVIRVISGVVHYKLYATGDYQSILTQGTLSEGMEVSIEPLRSHYVFTSDNDAYLRVTFFTPPTHAI